MTTMTTTTTTTTVVLKEVLAAKNYTLKPRVVLPEDYVKVCQDDLVHQLRFMRHNADPQANDVLNGVLAGLDATPCPRQITLQDDRSEQFMTAKKYFIIFTNNLPSGVAEFRKFLSWKVIRFGSARLVVLVLLLDPQFDALQMFGFGRYELVYNLVLLFYNRQGVVESFTLEPFQRKVIPLHTVQPDFGTLEELFYRQYRDLHGHELNVYFTRGDISQRTLTTNRYAYFIDVLARRLNARYRIHTDSIGKWNEQHRMDFGMVYDSYGNHPIKRIPLRQFSYHCILSPRSHRKSFIRILIDPFNWIVWMGLVGVTLLTSYLLHRYGFHRPKSWPTVYFWIFQTFINGPPRAGVYTRAGNCILTAYIYVSLILATLYQSTLTSHLSRSLYYPEYETVRDVNDSGIPVFVSPFVKHVSTIRFAGQVDRQQIVDPAQQMMQHGVPTFHMVIPCDVAEQLVLIGASGSVHLVKERVAPFQDTFVLFRYSPFDELLDFHWTAFLEGDLFRYWTTRNKNVGNYRGSFGGLRRPGIQHTKAWTADESIRAFRVSDLLICWSIVAVGLMLALGSFCIERVLARKKKRQNQKDRKVRPPSRKGTPVVVEFSIFVQHKHQHQQQHQLLYAANHRHLR
ncbi:hypothetical protein AND_001958 [Anopheles darlingi]|uniref:Ionotropic glutamate receptor L-glutamate and glycine-binding domain-containing protein n=1 Tax=Anopheles darlingi TaxID=43151 RepID=W5JSG6_ANODA|nr:hypothetical protein AND_001958 [Anopheles darlingi]